MRSTKPMTLKLLSLAAVLVGAAGLAACGGGGSLPGSTTLLLGGPVTTPPPSGGNLPDPIPLPPGGGGGSPVDPVDPAPVDPPVDPPTEPTPPPEEPPAPTPAPDLARVSAMADVPENALVAEAAEAYVGLYVADEDGGIWRRLASGGWKQVGATGLAGTVEAMTYVRTRHALYLAIDAQAHGQVLARWLLTPTPEVFDTTVEPPVLVDAGGVQFQLLENAAGQARFDGASRITGLAFDTATEVLFAWDHDGRALMHVADLDVAAATFDNQFNLAGGLLEDGQDLAYDRASGRMLIVDAAAAAVIELDHLGLAFHGLVTLPYADLRALAWVEGGERLAVDRASAALIRFDANGAVLE